MNAEKLLKKIRAVDPDRYRPTGSKFFVVLDSNRDQPFDAALGDSTEYTALLHLLERHKYDDRTIGLIYAFAQGLHGKPSTSMEGTK